MSKYEWDNHKDTNFSEFERFFRDSNIQPIYDTRSDYTTNAPSFYEYLSRHNHLIKILAKRIYDYDKELAKRFEEWDKRIENLPKELEELLIEWLKDGTLEHIINENIFNDLNNRKLEKNYQHKRHVFLSLPLKCPKWQEFNENNNNTRQHPQSFTIDWKAREIFIYYSPTSTTYTNDRLVAVYDIDTSQHKSSFLAGNAGGEGIVIRYINNSRYLFVKTRNNYLGRFLIDNLPTTLVKLDPENEYNIDVEWQFNYWDNTWYVVTAGSDYGSTFRKNSILTLDNSFNKTGAIFLDKSSSGLFNSKYENSKTKRQGIAVGNSKIYLGMGGYSKKDATSDYGNYGVRVLNMAGQIIDEGLTRPNLMDKKLQELGYHVDSIENEGVHVSPTGEVYSLLVHSSLDRDYAENEGIIIFEEFSTNINAIDFSKESASQSLINYDLINSSMYPRSYEGKYINQLTGELFTNIPQIIEYMFETSITQIKMFSGVQDLTSLYFPNGINNDYLITITNINNVSAIIEYTGSPAISDVKTKYYKRDNEYVENVIYDNRWFEMTLEEGITTIYAGETPRVIVSNHVKTLHGHVKGIGGITEFPFKLGTLPKEVRPLNNRVMITAMSTSAVGGYAVISVQASGEVLLHYKEKNLTTVSFNGLSYY